MTDIYIAEITDPLWICLFLFGCLLFCIIQRIGQRLHSELLSRTQKQSISDKLFGGQCQSMFHSMMVSIVCITLLIKYRIDNFDAISDAENSLIAIGRIVSVLSTSYFLVITIYDGFIYRDLPNNERIVICIHHILSMLTTAFVYPAKPFGLLLWANIVQVEASTIFLNLRLFGRNFEQKIAFLIGSIGTLISYPLTRIVFLSHTIFLTFSHKVELIGIIGENAVYLVLVCEIFVVLMSTAYFGKIATNASEFMQMDRERTVEYSDVSSIEV